MKAFYALFLLVFLASCGADTSTQVIKQTNDNSAVNQTADDIDVSLSDISTSNNAPSEEPPVIDTSVELDTEAPSEDAPIIDTDVKIEGEVPSEEPPVIEENLSEPDNAPSEEPPVIENNSEAEADSSEDNQEPISEEKADDVSTENSLIELSTTYNNPKIEVVMNISIDVDDNDVIESISVTSPNYGGMPEFNSGIQKVVGMSVSEASEYYVSGSSLTTPAFQKALKEVL